jgi:transcriptional regulator with XRE-family HTH domain
MPENLLCWGEPRGGETVKVRLREWRQRRLLTQEELADKAGVGVTTIVRIEAGQGARISTLRKLAQALEITPEQLMGDDRGDARAA